MTDKKEVLPTPSAEKVTRPTSFFLKESVAPVPNLFAAVSNRITDEQGVPVMFEFKALKPAEITELENKHQKVKRDGKNRVVGKELDAEAYSLSIAIDSCVYPDLRSAEMLDSWGVKTPEALLRAMLSIEGELNRFQVAALKVNEIGKDFEELVDEAKIE